MVERKRISKTMMKNMLANEIPENADKMFANERQELNHIYIPRLGGRL